MCTIIDTLYMSSTYTHSYRIVHWYEARHQPQHSEALLNILDLGDLELPVTFGLQIILAESMLWPRQK